MLEKLIDEVRELNRSVDAGNEVALDTAIVQQELVQTFAAEYSSLSGVLANIQMQLEINNDLVSELIESPVEPLSMSTEDKRESDRVVELQTEYMEDTAHFVRKIYEFMTDNAGKFGMDVGKAGMMGAVAGIAETMIAGRAATTAAGMLAGAGAGAALAGDADETNKGGKDKTNSTKKPSAIKRGLMKLKPSFSLPGLVGSLAVGFLIEAFDIDMTGLKKRLNDLTFDEVITGLSNLATDFVSGLYNYVVEEQGGLGSGLFGAAKGAMAGAVFGIPGMIVGAIVGGIASAIGQERINQFASDFGQMITDTWQSIKDFFSGIFDSITGWLNDVVENGLDGLKSFDEWVTSKTGKGDNTNWQEDFGDTPNYRPVEEFDQMIADKQARIAELQAVQTMVPVETLFNNNNVNSYQYAVPLQNPYMAVEDQIRDLQRQIEQDKENRAISAQNNISSQQVFQTNNSTNVSTVPKVPYNPSKRNQE